MINSIETSIPEIVAQFKSLQDRICEGLESLDGNVKFEQDLWQRPEGGGGRTRILQNGNVYERGGVNFSHVHGPMPEKIASKLGFTTGERFDATGVSIVIHPKNPWVPIIHMNVRYFQMESGAYWFGGGIDVTPTYVMEEDAREFHQHLKEICDSFDPEYYPKFKAWCDRYFFLKHRNETRGIGGLFFDRLVGDSPEAKQKLFEFVLEVGNAFVPIYARLTKKYANKSFSEREKQFQSLRRSRYVEFNLLFDAGTRFGIETGGRTESILMSMPPMAQWTYNYQPEPGSPEAKTLSLLKPIDWIP